MNKRRIWIYRLRKFKVIETFLGLLCIAFICYSQFVNLPLVTQTINQFEYWIYDQTISHNLLVPKRNPNVVVIDIDEVSIEKIGRWPWPRDKLALLIKKLKQYGVVITGLDIVMPEAEINYAQGLENKLMELTPKPNSDELKLYSTLNNITSKVDNDEFFAKTISDHTDILGFLFENDVYKSIGALPDPLNYTIDNGQNIDSLDLYDFKTFIGPLKMFMQTATKAGFVTNFPDADGTVRRSLFLAKYQGKLYPNLALTTAMSYLLIDKVKLLTRDNKLYGIGLDGNFIPTNSHGQVLIPFWGPPESLNYYSAVDIFDGKINPQALNGAIAIIGSSITLLADIHQTPLSLYFPGVELVGNIVQAIVDKGMPSEYDWQSLNGKLILIGIGLLFALLLPYLNIASKIIVCILSIILIATTSIYAFQNKLLYIPIAFLLMLIILQTLVNLIYSFILDRLQKRKLSHLFGQYVPAEYVKELIDSEGKYSMEGQTRNMTVLFADIRGFTSISESLDATEVKNLLNTFFTPITEIIFKYRGTIDKYVGDMIVAFWGAPIPDKQHTEHAIDAALDIFKFLPEINNTMKSMNLPSVNLGLGLASGMMNVGDMGSKFRRAYTVLGDIVNLGSRLEGLTKFYKIDILVNDNTREGQNAYLWRTIDKVSVQGRKTALFIYEPLCKLKDASTTLLEETKTYHAALEIYYARKWTEAEKEFTELAKAHPRTYLYQIYLERISGFKKSPPPADWNGVYVHASK